MKVLLVGDYPPPHGGVAVHVQQLHQFLRARGVEVRVLDIGKGGRPAPDVLSARSLPAFAARIAQFSLRGWTLHLHTSGNNPKSWALVAAVGLARSPLGPPPLVTLHSGLLAPFLSASRVHASFARLALSRYGRVIAVSEVMREALLAVHVEAGKLAVHPAFLASQVSPGEPPPGLAPVRARRRPLFAMAHHPSPVYGRALMLAALKELAPRLPDCGLALFGPGTRTAELQVAAHQLGLSDRIDDFGELPHPQALALIAASDAFIRPTTADGDSISVREALALGVPCVASDVAVRPAGTRIFRGGDVASLVEALAQPLPRPGPLAGPDVGEALLQIYRTPASFEGELHATP